MKSIINWFKKSNRWKHLVGGIVIGLMTESAYSAVYTGLCVAGALEFKDKQWGGEWDWFDFALTFVGTCIGYGLFLLIAFIL